VDSSDTAPNPRLLSAMSDFISTESERGIVYVHCKIGYSRSAAAVGAWLLANRRATTAQGAIAMLCRGRPTIVVRPEVRSALAQFASGIAGNKSPKLRKLQDHTTPDRLEPRPLLG
jgi:protein-tyrosine phosphatase